MNAPFSMQHFRDMLELLEVVGPDSLLARQLRGHLGAHGLIGGGELVRLVESGVIDADPAHINAASIDVRLGGEFFFEDDTGLCSVDLPKKDELAFERLQAAEGEAVFVQPGEFFLTHTVETLALPDDISCLFLLRSSCARAGLEHSQAGFGDAGFHGQLTLEFKNITRYHRMALRPGMRIGQILFLRHADAGERSYRLKGRYGGQTGVQVSKGAA